MEYRRIDREISLLHQEYNGAHTFEDKPFIPTPERVESLTSRAEELRAHVGDAPANGGGVDGVLRAHFRESLEELLGRLRDDQGYPFRYVFQVTEGINALVEQDPRGSDVKAEVLRARLAQLPDLLAATVRATGRTAADRRWMTVETVDNAAGLLRRMRGRVQEAWAEGGDAASAGLLKALDNTFDAAIAACRRAVDDVERLPDAESPVLGLSYRDLLAQVFGASVDELAERTRDDVAALEAEMARLAREIDPSKTAARILEEDVTPYDTPEEMLSAMREMAAQTRDVCAGIVDLPPGEVCRIEPVPPHLEELFPWGGYSGPDALAGHRVGSCYINLKNYRSISRGWLMNMALHEAYPGHHTQYVCSSGGGLPLTAKLTQLYSRGSHALEGMAHRSEKKFQHIYGDPTFPLFVVYRQMHTAVRILCELEINHYENGVPAALALYDKYMGFPEQVARGQARLQQMWRGYMTSYFTGHRQFDAIQRETGLGDDEFTRLLFTHGFVSVATLGRIARLKPSERSRVYADFEGEEV